MFVVSQAFLVASNHDKARPNKNHTVTMLDKYSIRLDNIILNISCCYVKTNFE